MKFQAAYNYMKSGRRITLPEWGGYWAWCEGCQSIIMHTARGDQLDIRESENMDFTLAFTFRDDWEKLSDDAVTQYDLAVAWFAEDELDEEDEDEELLEQVETILALLAERAPQEEEEAEEEPCTIAFYVR